MKWQALALAGVVLISAFLTRVGVESGRAVESLSSDNTVFISSGSGISPSDSDPSLRASLSPAQAPEARHVPLRDWGVLDPQVSAEAVLAQSLDSSFPFFHKKTYVSWPTASLAKLLTSVVVLEDIGANKKIMITERAVATDGLAGNLQTGEIYSAQDLLKIMLLSSSNDAAAAFEDYAGGTDEFIRLMNRKARELGMTGSLFYDASGLSSLNSSTASDLLRLFRYVAESHPQILQWTRIPSFLVQPVNDVESRLVTNINPLVAEPEFLGGKTGTSPRAGENLIALFSLGDERVVMILLGSKDRVADAERLLKWIEQAYGNL